MKMNETNTMPAPIQYAALEYCEASIICPISDSGIVRPSPTVTTSGDVNSMANAQARSEKKDAREFAYLIKLA